MQPRLRRALALLFSLLLVSTATVGPALASQVLERVSVEPATSPPGGGPPGEGSPGGGGGPGDGAGGGGPPGEGPPDGNSSDDSPGEPGDGDEGSGGPPANAGPPGDDGPPSGAGPPADAPGGPPGDGPNGDENPDGGPPTLNVTLAVDLGPNATALDHRRAAAAMLASANADGPGRSGGALLRRLGPLLNGTFEHVLDERRVLSAAVFKDDMRVAAPLHRRAPNVTRHLIISDRKLAAQAIDDAETVRAALDERNVSYDAAAVEANITAAREAYWQGQLTPEPASHSAIPHYREAWTHAQRAIDIMDEAVSPNVTVESRSDLPHNESRTVNVTGQVFEIRPYELEGTVEFNGTARELDLSNQTAPLANVSFDASVTLERQWPRFENGSLTDVGVVRVYTANASVRDPGIDLADQGYDEEQRDLHGPQVAGGELHFDGDGLPGRYEKAVTGTDPLDPDSDVPATNASEAGDGVVDGVEDPDDESLINFREFQLGTDPLAADTDGDRLTDDFEAFWELDPLATDGDGDGVTDDREDPDDDGLANLDEQRAGTTPTDNDTDRDGLLDGQEVDDFGTDPTARDTDDDGLTDPDELTLDTAPTVPDTDGDGVLDGNETFTTTVEGNETGAVVELTGEGNVAGEVTVANVTGPNTTDLGAGPAVFVDNETTFEEATVHVPVGQAVDLGANGSDLTLVKLEEGSGEGWQEVNATLDEDDRTMVATVTSFSAFVVVDEDRFEELTRATIEAGWPHIETFERDTGWSGDFIRFEDGVLVVTNTHEGDDADEVECETPELSGDCDDDGLSNEVELAADTELDDPDTDNDGLDDGTEVEGETDPTDADTDDDGLEDGEEADGPTDPTDPDTDGDGVEDGEDECPTTAGEGEDGCEEEDDGDGGGGGGGGGGGESTATPSEPTPTPPPEDSDGDGVNDPNDPCPDDPGHDPESGCSFQPESVGLTADGEVIVDSTTSSTAVHALDLPDPAEEATITVRLEATIGLASEVRVEVLGSDGREATVATLSEDTAGVTTVSESLSFLAPGTAEVRIVAEGDATAIVEEVRVRRDSDGDGIRDVVERRADVEGLRFWSLQVFEGEIDPTRKVSRNPVELDATEVDTDDDGLRDDEEVSIEVDREGDTLEISMGDSVSLPGVFDTDRDGLGDGVERGLGTDPLDPDSDDDGYSDKEDRRLPLIPNNGWTVHVWKVRGVNEVFKSAILSGFEELDNQVNFDIKVEDEGTAPRRLMTCESSDTARMEFNEWLRTNRKVDIGEEHLLIANCRHVPGREEDTFPSRNHGDLRHYPEEEQFDNENPAEDTHNYGRGIVNGFVTHLDGPTETRVQATAIHEFGHSAIEPRRGDSACQLDAVNQGVNIPNAEHSCGQRFNDISPMIVGHPFKFSPQDLCGGISRNTLSTTPTYTTTISACTERALERYHKSN